MLINIIAIAIGILSSFYISRFLLKEKVEEIESVARYRDMISDCRDQEIEDSEHRSIADIFAQNGEKYFREIEAKTIQEIVNRDEEIVLSLGGGAFINSETRKILKQKTSIIWLHASIEETLKRVGSKPNRPLLNQKNKRQILHH